MPEDKVTTLDIVMLLLTIIALGIAVLHERKLDGAVDRIGRIQDGLSTQYLGPFPSFFPRIVKVVNSAQKNIVIVCDFPAYANFSQPATSEDYFYAIKKRQPIVSSEVTVPNAAGRARVLEALFSVDQWSDWKTIPEKRVQVERFLQRHARQPDSIHTREDLLRVLAEVNNETSHDVFLDRINESSSDIPIYFWVADCHDAVFSIASPSEGVEQGFYTSDKSLIRSLLDVRKRLGANPATVASRLKPCD